MKLSVHESVFGSGRTQWQKIGKWLVVAVGGLMILWVFWRFGPTGYKPMPDFQRIDNISERKAAFFEFLHPFVRQANHEIEYQRWRLAVLSNRLERGHLNRRNESWLRRMAGDYEIGHEEERIDRELIKDLLKRIDVIPASMALAQAALESGWGTSRFAQRGNNLYGIWCYEPGCGLVPRNRPAGATYEVKKYRSPRECFEDYIQNLNTNTAYASVWQIRSDQRRDGSSPTGLAVADGLYRYSQEGWGYVEKVKRMIRSNNLQHYDEL